MVSTLKSETARVNGAKSRGPTTAEGKEKSSRNSIKHGLTAGNGNILLDCEDPDQFDEVLNKLLGIHEPATPAETDLVEEMFACRWRTRRMWTIETGLLNAEILTQQSKTDTPDPNIHLTMAFRSLTDDSRSGGPDQPPLKQNYEMYLRMLQTKVRAPRAWTGRWTRNTRLRSKEHFLTQIYDPQGKSRGEITSGK